MKKISIIVSLLSVFILTGLLAFAQTPTLKKVSTPVLKITPDITITSLKVLPTRRITSPNAIRRMPLPTISCKWKRTGSAPESKWAIKIFTGGKMIKGAWIEPDAGTSGELKVQQLLTVGEHSILCEVDAENNVSETNEKNNKWLIIHTVKPPKKTDIIVKKVYLAPLSGGKIESGQNVWMRCDWERTGPAPAGKLHRKKICRW